MSLRPVAPSSSRALRIIVPIVIGILFLAFWEFGVRHFGVSKFVLPPPSSIAEALVDDFGSLSQSLWNTLRVTLEAFFTALISAFCSLSCSRAPSCSK